jgi:hypothetical protein
VLNDGEIAGIVIGVIIAAGVIGVGVLSYIAYRNRVLLQPLFLSFLKNKKSHQICK